MNVYKLFIIFLISLGSCHLAEAQNYPKQEFRAAWLTTVSNMDWPSKPGLSAEEQKAELIAYLDLFKKLNFNAVVLHIRPCADAFYASPYEPWSEFLTGVQGKDPGYDPLQFAIDECHKRCMELHAWLNPYRGTRNNDYSKLASTHIYRQHPEWFVPYKDKTYFDPGIPEARAFVCKVVKDIVSRYDVDAIHFDDYFYPYSDFNDSLSFLKYNRGYKMDMKDDWRRDNVDTLIRMLHDTIKSVKPYVKFGISPYAVWRNKRDDARGSDTKSFAYTNYDHLYANIRLWLEKGWIDYVLPQLYFSIGYERLDFRVAADWWGANSFGHGLYAGIGTYRLDKGAKEAAWRSASEIVKQARYIRQNSSFGGFCYFTASNFKNNILGINDTIIKRINPYPALIPPVAGLPVQIPPAPSHPEFDAKSRLLTWKVNMKEGQLPSVWFVVYRFAKKTVPDFSNASAIVAKVSMPQIVLEDEPPGEYNYFVTALNRLSTESLPSERVAIKCTKARKHKNKLKLNK